MIYEQPLNEQMRLCLRLEYLFSQADYYLLKSGMWNTHQVIKIVLEILQAIERPDLKNKFSQSLTQLSSNLAKLKELKEIDQLKLNQTLEKIELLMEAIHSSAKKIGQELRDNEFLASIQQKLFTPGGTCGFSLPSYQAWLQQPPLLQQRQLFSWFNQLKLLQDIVNTILPIVRDSAAFTKTVTQGGIFQNQLSANNYYQMIRLKLPPDKKLYPEISVGKYRITIYFFTIELDGKTKQNTQDLSFDLAYCKI